MDAEDLYRVAPEDFTAARNAAAKQARADGDRAAAAALKALRRPTVAAWLLNRLVREQPGLVEQLLSLGPDLAQAQSGGDAAALRALGEQRRQLVGAVTDTAVGSSGRSVTAAVREEVSRTLDAALADPASADAVRTGRLVRALSYAGFGEGDLSDAVAPAGPRRAGAQDPTDTGATSPVSPAGPTRQQLQARRLAEVEAASHDAAGRLDDAVRACRAAEAAHDAAQRTEQDRAADLERLRGELERARQDHDGAAAARTSAARAADGARKQVERAQRRAEAARAELDRLRREGR